MGKSDVAKSVAKKMSAGSEDALQIIERLLPTGSDDAAREALRKNPEAYKEYLSALDEAYGNRAKRAKDLGFESDKYYHGTNKDFNTFDPGKTTHNYSAFVTPDKKIAKWYANRNLDAEGGEPIIKELQIRGKPVDPYIELKNAGLLDSHDEGWDIANTWKTIEHGEGVPEFLKEKGIKNVKMTEQMGKLDSIPVGTQKTSRTIAISDPKDIRSTNAAFDPRFKDSADILALQKAPETLGKIIAKTMPRTNFGLGKAFGDILEPVEKLDKPVNDAVKFVSDKVAEQTNLVPKNAQSPTTEYAETVRRAGLDTALNIAAPTPSSLLVGKAMPLMKAAKGTQIAEKMVKPQSAAEMYREAKAAIKSNFGTVVVKPDAVPKLGSVIIKP